MPTPTPTIRHQIAFGLALVLVMALLTIFAVVEWKVKPDLIDQRHQKIAISQHGLLDLLDAKLGQIELLTSTIALKGTNLPKDEALFRSLFPPIFNNHGDPTIAGGGIWPEPNTFTPGVERRSFFWGRTGPDMEYYDDYNNPDGKGYHNERWYLAGKQAPIDRCRWSNAYIDPFTKESMITCTVPMKENDRFVGVATVDMKLSGIADILSRYGKENDGYVFALDADNKAISFPEVAVRFNPYRNTLRTVTELEQALPWLQEALQASQSLQDSQLITIKNDGVLNEAAYVHIIKYPQTDWVIGLVVPKSKMTAAADSMGLFLMFAIGGLLLVVGIIAAITARNLLGKIQQTTQQIRELIEGETTQELAVGKMNEVGELRQAVNAYGEKLKSLLRRLEAIQEELVQNEKLASLGSLVSGVAHELNTPIGNARMSSTSILDTKHEFVHKLEQPITRDDLDQFLNHVEDGTRIIERNMLRASELIRAFKQLAVDQTSDHRRDFELHLLMNEVLLSMRPTLQRAPHQLEVAIPAGILLNSYPGALTQTLINLINNALIHAFIGRDTGHIHIIATMATTESVSIRIHDDGAGMTPEVQKRIFDPFYTTRLGQGGSGLGLHITFNLVTGILGGRIEVQSEPEHGSCFTITLPLIAPERALPNSEGAS
ncbi:sensor histidine kinase [Salinivibrio sp. EAGSL]|uniref:sensor histidine kinase n=1 Tax=Salinivibrio sp. EAGSL TaxID=2738468 RepID=UPI00158E58E2|nr:sensor histidine kinase [Salinivibrio sp. EAGSL]NUY56173.1 sensor histidine kinase [Salinivibrio sp. EAGSL]